MRHFLNKPRSVRMSSGSIGRGNAIVHLERLESRAGLSAESAVMLPTPIALSGVVDAADASPFTVASTTVIQPVAVARLRLTMPAQVRAGAPTLMTAVALDAAGRTVPSFNGSATVTSSDGAASLPLIEVSFKNGRALFAVTFATAGPQTVTVTSLADSAMTATASTAVTAPPTLGSFLVLMPRRVDAGKPVNVTIVAADAAQRPIPRFSGTAMLTSSDSAATLPASVNLVNGRATARVTFFTSGSQSLAVRGGAAGAIVATAATEVVATPVATAFAFRLPKAVAVGVPVNVTIVAVDAQGRTVPSFSGTATLASSDTAATLPPVRFVAGRAVVRVTFGTLGEQRLTVTSDPSSGGGVSGTAKTQVGEVVTQRIRSLPAARS